MKSDKVGGGRRDQPQLSKSGRADSLLILEDP